MVTSKAQKQSKKFIIVFLATIIIIRILIFYIPAFIPEARIIWQDKFHHAFLGIILLAIYFLIKTKKYAFYFLAIALGLIVDQIAAAPFYIADLINKPLAPYLFWYSWSPYNIISTTILIIISIYIIKRYKK